jgi:hypothetical protein
MIDYYSLLKEDAMQQTQRQHPSTRGLNWHRDQYYSFFVPIEWHRFAWGEGQQGVIYGPDLDNPSTVFAVDFKDLGMPITADDFEILSEGFFEAIEALPQAQIELRNHKQAEAILELEAKYTFQEQSQTRKRWVRVFYQDSRQIAMTAQGATTEKYDYWLPWFFEAMMTARIHREKPTSPLNF